MRIATLLFCSLMTVHRRPIAIIGTAKTTKTRDLSTEADVGEGGRSRSYTKVIPRQAHFLCHRGKGVKVGLCLGCTIWLLKMVSNLKIGVGLLPKGDKPLSFLSLCPSVALVVQSGFPKFRSCGRGLAPGMSMRGLA
jgi:hypothetical protein